MTSVITEVTSNLTARFPGFITADPRPGYNGWIVDKSHLLEFATLMRDELGYDYLSSVTGGDYLPEGKMEVVYHVYKTTGRTGLVFKVQVPHQDPVEVPSIVPIYSGAELQEREAWDLLGIQFIGHPVLRRILLWEGFAGHPLRKDWHEAYFEEENKPFKSRWPEGKIVRAEVGNPFNNNVDYPPGFDPEKYLPEGEAALYGALIKYDQKETNGLTSDYVVVNIGPQHPSTHGVFRMAVILDSETVIDLKPVMGYLHRCHEKIGERNTYLQNLPYTDRLDYLASMSNNFGNVLAVEKLMGVSVPEHAEYIRIMMAELTRISNHLWAIGFFLNELGAMFTPMIYAVEERELILDIFEAVTGARLLCNYFRFGGVARDLPEGILEKIGELVSERLPRKIDELDLYLSRNEIVQSRSVNQGILTPEDAIRYSASGPVLRASGVPCDIRRAEPYSLYDRFEFDVVVGKHGDVYDRYMLEEMRQSLRIVQQVIKSIPQGEIQSGKAMYQVRVPAGETYSRVEDPKGELGFYIVSTGKPNPWRYHVRAPSFINITALRPMCIG